MGTQKSRKAMASVARGGAAVVAMGWFLAGPTAVAAAEGDAPVTSAADNSQQAPSGAAGQTDSGSATASSGRGEREAGPRHGRTPVSAQSAASLETDVPPDDEQSLLIDVPANVIAPVTPAEPEVGTLPTELASTTYDIDTATPAEADESSPPPARSRSGSDVPNPVERAVQASLLSTSAPAQTTLDDGTSAALPNAFIPAPVLSAPPVEAESLADPGDVTPIVQSATASPIVLASPPAAIVRWSTIAPPVAQLAAPAGAGKLDDAVAKVFDALAEWSATLPSQQLGDLFAGTLLMVRRSLFNHAPSASPVQETTTSAGLVTGSLGAIDPESDALAYTVVSGPRFGAVEVGADGTYTYTPGANYTGSDSFTVKVSDTSTGLNILNLGADRSTEVAVQVGVGASTNPFRAGNRNDSTLFLGDTAARISVDRENGKLIGTVSLKAPGGTALTWLDEQGRIGRISLAEAAARWDGIQSAGDVRLGIDYTLENGADAAMVLTSVTAVATDTGEYVFTGELAQDVQDGQGTDSFWDVVGNEYKSAYENFRQESGVDNDFQSFTKDVRDAEFHLDTFSVYDFEQELAEAGRVVVGGGAAIPQQPAASATTSTSDRLRKAVAFAQGGGIALSPDDPVFGQAEFQPACRATSTCTGTFLPFNMSLPPTSLASTSFALGDDNQSVAVSYDLGETSYGYVYVPNGLWDMLDVGKYSFGLMLAATTGPSVDLSLANGQGNYSYAPTKLAGGTVGASVGIGSVEIGGDVLAGLDASLNLPADAAKTNVKGSVYVTGGVILTYNTNDVPGFQSDADFYVDTDWSDPKVSGASVTANLTPTVNGSVSLHTPADTFLIGKVSIIDFLKLSYANPVSLGLQFPADGAPAITAASSGKLSVNAGLISWLTDALTFNQTFDIYNVSTDNLLTTVGDLVGA